MSIISAQIDELRELATRYDELQAGAVKAVTMPSDMGSILRDAADTIWQLRDDLQRANDAVRDGEHDESMAWDRVRKAEAESEKLREELEQWHRLTAGIELPEYPITEFKPKDLERENAKLRELAADMLKAMRHMEESAGMDVMVGYSPWFAPKLHELGVEVE